MSSFTNKEPAKPIDFEAKDSPTKERRAQTKAKDACLSDVFPIAGVVENSRATNNPRTGDIGVAYVKVNEGSIKYDSKSTVEGIEVETDKDKTEVRDKKTGSKLTWNSQAGKGKVSNKKNETIFEVDGANHSVTTFVNPDKATGSNPARITQTTKTYEELLGGIKVAPSVLPTDGASNTTTITTNTEGDYSVSAKDLAVISSRSSGQLFLNAKTLDSLSADSSESGISLMVKDNKLYKLPADFKFNDAAAHSGDYAKPEMEIKDAATKGLLVRTKDGAPTQISLANNGEVKIGDVIINVKSGELTMPSENGPVKAKSGDGQSSVNNSGLSDLTLTRNGGITNKAQETSVFTEYNPTNGTVSGSTSDKTNYTINGREIRIDNRGHHTVINPSSRHPVTSTDERSGLTLRFDGSGRMTVNGVPIGPLTEEQEEEEEGSGKSSKKGGLAGKVQDEQQVSSTLVEGINIAALIESSYFNNAAERSKLLSLVQHSSIRIAMAALNATASGNLPLVTLLNEGLSELGDAESSLNKT